MTQAPSYYDILGVSRTASSEEIRSAYLRLMKRHHPDRAGAETSPHDPAALLNRCYAVLRDPAQRSQYDAQFQPARLVPSARRVSQPPPRSRTPRSWAVVLVTGVAAGVLFTALSFVTEPMARRYRAAANAWLLPQQRETPTFATAAQLDASALKTLVEFARTSAPAEAQRFSRECFAERVTGGVEQCILFDIAFLYWQKPPQAGADFPTYFADEIVEHRHRGAMAVYGLSADKRLTGLREQGFRAVIDAVQPSGSSAEQAGTTEASSRSADLEVGERERLAPVVPE